MAQQYSGLRILLVEYQLQRLHCVHGNLQLLSDGQDELLPSHLDMNAQPVASGYDFSADAMLECIDLGNEPIGWTGQT